MNLICLPHHTSKCGILYLLVAKINDPTQLGNIYAWMEAKRVEQYDVIILRSLYSDSCHTCSEQSVIELCLHRCKTTTNIVHWDILVLMQFNWKCISISFQLNFAFLCNIIRVLVTKLRAVNSPDSNQSK